MIETQVISQENVSDEYEIDVDRKDEFDRYVIWNSIPALIKRPPKDKAGNQPTSKEFAESLGIQDDEILDLCQIKTNTEFAEKYSVHLNTLTKWRKKIRENNLNGFPIIKNWARELTSNLLLSLYNHAMKKGNPFAYKLYFQIVNDWEEKQSIEHKFIPIQEIEHGDVKQIDDNNKTQNQLAENGKTEDSI